MINEISSYNQSFPNFTGGQTDFRRTLSEKYQKNATVTAKKDTMDFKLNTL
jgi:hypothetical protein